MADEYTYSFEQRQSGTKTSVFFGGMMKLKLGKADVKDFFLLPGRVVYADAGQVDKPASLEAYARTAFLNKKEILLGPDTTVDKIDKEGVVVVTQPPSVGSTHANSKVRIKLTQPDRLAKFTSELQQRTHHRYFDELLSSQNPVVAVAINTAMWERFYKGDVALWDLYFTAKTSPGVSKIAQRLIFFGSVLLHDTLNVKVDAPTLDLLHVPGAATALVSFLAAVASLPSVRAVVLAFQLAVKPNDRSASARELFGSLALGVGALPQPSALQSPAEQLAFVAAQLPVLVAHEQLGAHNIVKLLRYPDGATLASNAELDWFRKLPLQTARQADALSKLFVIHGSDFFRLFDNHAKACANVMMTYAASTGDVDSIAAAANYLTRETLVASLTGGTSPGAHGSGAPRDETARSNLALPSSSSLTTLTSLPQPPAVVLLLHQRLHDDQLFARACEVILRASAIVDDAFLAVLARHALAERRENVLLKFIANVLFDSATSAYNRQVFSRLRAPAPTLIEVLVDGAASVGLDMTSDLVRRIIEYILRMERIGTYPDGRHLTTLQAWLGTPDGVADNISSPASLPSALSSLALSSLPLAPTALFSRQAAVTDADDTPRRRKQLVNKVLEASQFSSDFFVNVLVFNDPANQITLPVRGGSAEKTGADTVDRPLPALPPADRGRQVVITGPIGGVQGDPTAPPPYGADGVGVGIGVGGPGVDGDTKARDAADLMANASAPPLPKKLPGGGGNGDSADSALGPGPGPGTPLTNWQHRTHGMLLEALYGYFAVQLFVNADKLVGFLNHSNLADFFQHYFVGDFRAEIVELLSSGWGMRPPFQQQALLGNLMNKRTHFKRAALDVLKLEPMNVSDQLFTSLVVTAFKLASFESLPTRLRNVELSASRSQEVATQLTLILNATVAKRDEEFLTPGTDESSGISIDDLSKCAYDASLAMQALMEGRAAQRLHHMFAHYLANMPPKSWPGLFKSAETVAFFIKYIDQEDLPKAARALIELNRTAIPSVTTAVADATTQYNKQMITVDDVPVEQGKEAVERGIQGLQARSDNPGLTPEVSWAMKVGVVWMRQCLKTIAIPMAPRNSQVLAFLACLRWAHLAGSMPGRGGLTPTTRLRPATVMQGPKTLRSLIAQVGTGEGKSLIIAMLAVYLVKATGRTVHIMENNVSLLERDHASFTSFFGAFDISTTKNFDDARAQVVYCLRIDVERQYQSQAEKAEQPLFNTVLIVDEVDELIVDENPNQGFVRDDATTTDAIRQCFEVLKKSGNFSASAASKPPQVAQVLWNQACNAASRARTMTRDVPDGYHIDKDGTAHLLDSRGNPTAKWSLACEYLTYTHTNRASYQPRHLTSYFVQSMPHVLRQYDLIYGLSGSLGSPAERDFLQKTYGAEFLVVPPFLTTCTRARKQELRLLDNVVHVYTRADAQEMQVLNVALQRHLDVPVLIICASPKLASLMCERLKARMRKPGSATLPHADELIQQFAMTDTKTNWNTILEKSTLPLLLGNDRRYWRITVTDYFGGRGHDYRVRLSDDAVDQAGGLLVIMTCIPESQREWVQWCGRTARADRKGQYAVLLSSEDPFLKTQQEVIDKYRLPGSDPTAHALEIIQALLDERDKGLLSKLDSLKTDVRRGLQLNELCDRFYFKHPYSGSGWPAGVHVKLRDFLESWSYKDENDIAEFAANNGLAESAQEYKQSSAYINYK